ncbi:hypothetical protein TNCV_3019361 [Trichonephila clavipes]|nr:hypothetical protein TNCV_3019361 [Trichonephila clavipes]
MSVRNPSVTFTQAHSPAKRAYRNYHFENAHEKGINEKHKAHMYLIMLNKAALPRNEAHLSVILKKVSISNNAHLSNGLRFPLPFLLRDTLAQASSIKRFRSSCRFDGGVVYTPFLMHHHKKSPKGLDQVPM